MSEKSTFTWLGPPSQIAPDVAKIACRRSCEHAGIEGLGWPVLDDGTAVVDQRSSIKGFGCGEFF